MCVYGERDAMVCVCEKTWGQVCGASPFLPNLCELPEFARPMPLPTEPPCQFLPFFFLKRRLLLNKELTDLARIAVQKLQRFTCFSVSPDLMIQVSTTSSSCYIGIEDRNSGRYLEQ